MNTEFELTDNGGVAFWVPCLPAPKGSSRAVPIPRKGARRCHACGFTPTTIAFVAGSADSTKEKQLNMEYNVRNAIRSFTRTYPQWSAYQGAVSMNINYIFVAPASRRRERFHTTYPDRDKLDRMLQDLIAPPKVKKVPDFDAPHLVHNDSAIPRGTSEKWWLHTWQNEVEDDYGIDEGGVLFTITPLEAIDIVAHQVSA